MSQQVVGDIFGLTRDGNGAFQIPGVPENDRGDEEVQTGGAILLVPTGAFRVRAASASLSVRRQNTSSIGEAR
jgi:hypothetical protein